MSDEMINNPIRESSNSYTEEDTWSVVGFQSFDSNYMDSLREKDAKEKEKKMMDRCVYISVFLFSLSAGGCLLYFYVFKNYH